MDVYATKNAFAKLMGWDRAYVTRLGEAGRLVFAPDGKRVDVEASKKLIEETAGAHGERAREYFAGKREEKAHTAGNSYESLSRDYSQSKYSPSRLAQPPANEPDTAPAPPDDNTGGDASGPGDAPSRAYWDRREAAAKAKIKELELAQLEGKLADVETIRRAGAEVGTLLRSSVENLVDQLAPVLTPITDEDRLRAVLVDHLETVLTEIAKKLSTLGDTPQTEGAG